MADKVTTFGTVIQLSISGTYTTVPGLITLTPPNPVRAEIEFGELDAEWMEKRVGRINPGECSFEVHLDPGNVVHQALASAFADRETISLWKIVYSDTGTTAQTFSGYLTEPHRPSFDGDGKLVGTYKIAVSGEIFES